MRAVLPGRPKSGLYALATGFWDSRHFNVYITGSAFTILCDPGTIVQTVYDEDPAHLQAVAFDEWSGKIATCTNSVIRVYKPFGQSEDALKWGLQSSFLIPDLRDAIDNTILSWGTSEELLVAHSVLCMYSTADEPNSIWTKTLPSPSKLAEISYDSAYIASVGFHDRLVKVWRRLTYGAEDVRFDLAYLRHPDIVTSIRWRKPYHIEQTVQNVLYTACVDNKIRIWTGSDPHAPQQLNLWGTIDLASAFREQSLRTVSPPSAFLAFIVDGRDVSAATELAVQRRPIQNGEQDNALEHLISLANKSPELCVAFNGAGETAVFVLEDDLDWTSTPDSQSILAVGFQSKASAMHASGSQISSHFDYQAAADEEDENFTEDVAYAINERLTKVDIEQLSGHEQIQLADIVECAGLVEKQRRSLDENGARFMLFFRQHALRKGRTSEIQMSWREINWAYHSTSQDILVDFVTKQCHSGIRWEDAKESGMFMWLGDRNALRAQFENVARNEYTKSDAKNPVDCSLYYLALKKKTVLQGLWRMAYGNREQATTQRFLANNFDDPVWRTKALKNAYALLSKRRFEYAAAFFLLADHLQDAVNSPVYTLIETPCTPDMQSKLFLTDDPALVVLYAQLRQKTLQTLRGASKVTPRVEWEFVLHSAKLYDRMGCDLLGLDLGCLSIDQGNVTATMAPNRGYHDGQLAVDATPAGGNSGADSFRQSPTIQGRSFTIRGVVVGLLVGLVICFSNMYFGLQTGWVSTMTMPASLMGFGIFKALARHLKFPFSPVENVLVQTVAGSMAIMPLGCGFVGVIPAMNYLLTTDEQGPLHISLWKLILWSLGLCYFGVVFAVPLASVLPDNYTEEDDADAPPEQQISNRLVSVGLVLSVLLCIMTIHIVFGDLVPLYATIVAVLMALLLSIMGSHKSSVLINLVAGAVSEAGALQAGDLMQDLKTGHLLGAAPDAQFWGQVIGATAGAVVSALVYQLYAAVYVIPGDLFQVPTGYVWIFTARLVTGKGMYNVPSFTLARTVGGLLSWYWISRRGQSSTPLIVLASGFILGEGFLSIVNLVLQSLSVPHY
ncbi:Regulator of V-ATPase in vacuolar membrane protein 1 [Colletotrichum sp. SAR 10_70]|nr:Regulator of V-ATPase in vacuolar membrane protein 1 [Colletotrichum sp. SAR 10_71]KAI8177762.1 Regulator of V-ATPase in vacuolar membrane protein 1 [Colletotrichum sp. SAR 10_70]KAI8179914.1 Regulator of V-ATPase in vacuolar membrane protein 1 [Colletotrichum sp. SAR 10_75]KAI8196414.1 Regulator of V-ATPase in vacuolar membrane protein 1 [Colletotrichum sp. SAR 10_65]KAI8201221.1 Regulator of V-ATPase in vacuolar membrane protein 1 [Colletotrichum sp. SAR 10_76]KAI8227424.1 Regulator of V-